RVGARGGAARGGGGGHRRGAAAARPPRAPAPRCSRVRRRAGGRPRQARRDCCQGGGQARYESWEEIKTLTQSRTQRSTSFVVLCIRVCEPSAARRDQTERSEAR